MDSACRLSHVAAHQETATIAGGALAAHMGSLTLERSNFTACQAMETGGAVLASDAQLSAVGCTFEGNSAGTDGGALHVLGGSNATLTDCMLSSNTAFTGGALLVTANSTASLERGALLNNSASVGGAVAATAAATLQLLTTSLRDNTAAVGGALAGFSADVLLNATRLSGNVARVPAGGAASVTFGIGVPSGVGGAVYLRSSSLDARGCLAADNKADAHGGAMYLERTEVALRDNALLRNAAGGAGGALKLANAAASMRFARNRWVGNMAARGGGGVAFAAGDLAADAFLLSEVFEGNAAGGEEASGGAVWVAGALLVLRVVPSGRGAVG